LRDANDANDARDEWPDGSNGALDDDDDARAIAAMRVDWLTRLIHDDSRIDSPFLVLSFYSLRTQFPGAP